MEYNDAVKFVTSVPPVDWEVIIDSMPMGERSKMRDFLESLSERAGMLAVYLDKRYGSGCGDQGHKDAAKAMNRAGKKIHVNVFGYNRFLGFHI